MRTGKIEFAARAAVAVVFALMASAMAARAADPVFPTGSRVGLVPPAGMIPTKIFPGFEDAAKNAAIVITTLPAAAYAQMEKEAVTGALRKQGISIEKREPIQLNIGKGFLISGRETADKARYRKWILVAAADDLTVFVNVQAPERDAAYTDGVVRAALATLSLRATVPDEEQLSLLPFTVGDLAGFHIEEVLPGRGLILIDPAEGGLDARLWIAALQGGPAEPSDRTNFAQLAFAEIGGIKNVQITMSEPLRIGGQPGFQTMAQATGSLSGIDMMVVQWLRFGSGGFLQMVGMGRADKWTALLARLRAVRDSIEPK